MDRMIPIGPTGREMIAQGKARNERRPGYSPGVVPSPVRARQRLSRAHSAEARVVPFPGLRSPLAPFDLGYHVPARWASGKAKLVGKGNQKSAIINAAPKRRDQFFSSEVRMSEALPGADPLHPRADVEALPAGMRKRIPFSP